MALYDGLTPTVFAAPTSIGAGNGAGESNAMALDTLRTLVGPNDVVGCLPGVYSKPVNSVRWVPAFKSVNSGSSASAPITYVGKYDHVLNYANPTLRCELRLTGTLKPTSGNTNGLTQAVIGADEGQAHIHWNNFFIDQTYVPAGPGRGLCVASGNTTGIQFRNIAIQQDVNIALDNYTSIYGQLSTNLFVDNCYIFGGYGSGNHNASGITLYSCFNYLFQHLTFENANCGIFIKGDMSGAANTQKSYGTIGLCKFKDLSNNGIELAHTHQTIPTYVLQNLIIRCQYGINIDNSAVTSDRRHIITNNTLVDCTINGGSNCNVENVAAGLTNNIYRDNISAYLSATSAKQINIDPTLTSAIFSALDYNLYYESGGSAQWADNGVTSTGIGAWRSRTGKDLNSSETNPNFVNASLDDYRLASPDTGSSIGGARGCYIAGTESIGAFSGGDTTPPAIPTGVMVS